MSTLTNEAEHNAVVESKEAVNLLGILSDLGIISFRHSEVFVDKQALLPSVKIQ